MAIQVGDNFSYQGAKPLDARLQYATIAEMKAKADATLYDGIIAFCKANSKNYQWKSTNPVDETLGKWREFESGGASDLDDLGDVEITDVADGDVLKYDATEEKWVNGEDVGGAGRAKSSAIAPEFDDTETYAAGDRVIYEDELYVFNKAHTGAWAAADADKSDVDSEIPDKLTSQQMQDIKDAFSGMNKGAPLRMMHYSTEEQVIGTWIDSKKIYQKSFDITNNVKALTVFGAYTDILNISSLNIEEVISCVGSIKLTRWRNVPYNFAFNDDTYDIAYSVALDGSYLGAYFAQGYTKVDMSTIQKAYATIQYTKTTDTPQ